MASFSLTANASNDVRKDEVVALMDKAVGHFKSVGMEQAAKDFADENGGYRMGELYIVIQKTDGTVLAHAVNPKLNGKNLHGIKDTDGKAFVAEMGEVAASKGEGWVNYKWVHPETKKIASKVTYVKRVEGDVFLLVGYYE